ncbi:DNA replication complex GINS protein PSF2 [Tupaia chinensis]|uniref:DNA replication complex GINS protein PSF2 n=1 Tax=Tupaia chinensis TaxID=246437 RepID=UPI0003C8CFEF|nr:DNA replication complex GINS protein PSF2 [Tupaia chinensis]
MDVENLEKIKDHEQKEETFTPMPSPYYMELTKLLLNHAADNIPKADAIRTLIKDMWDTRLAKLRVSADSFVRQQEAHAKQAAPSQQRLDRLCREGRGTRDAWLSTSFWGNSKMKRSRRRQWSRVGVGVRTRGALGVSPRSDSQYLQSAVDLRPLFSPSRPRSWEGARPTRHRSKSKHRSRGTSDVATQKTRAGPTCGLRAARC